MITKKKSTGRSSIRPPAKTATKGRKKEAADDRARRVALSVAEAGLDKKALEVEIIDVRGKVDYADYVVVMSGRSDRQVSALARNIEDEVTKKEKVACLSVEGLPQGSWVLMDFGDVVVHVFDPEDREFYQLEQFWSSGQPIAA